MILGVRRLLLREDELVLFLLVLEERFENLVFLKNEFDSFFEVLDSHSLPLEVLLHDGAGLAAVWVLLVPGSCCRGLFFFIGGLLRLELVLLV